MKVEINETDLAPLREIVEGRNHELRYGGKTNVTTEEINVIIKIIEQCQ